MPLLDPRVLVPEQNIDMFTSNYLSSDLNYFGSYFRQTNCMPCLMSPTQLCLEHRTLQMLEVLAMNMVSTSIFSNLSATGVSPMLPILTDPTHEQ